MKGNQGKYSSVFNSMVNLYKNEKQAYNNLEKMRLNPDLQNKSNGTIFREDLEFYVPQLCSFLINEELDESCAIRLTKVIYKACLADFYVAHRVFFFFYSSFEHISSEKSKFRAANILEMLKEQATMSEEQLYLANSDAYIEALYQTNT